MITYIFGGFISALNEPSVPCCADCALRKNWFAPPPAANASFGVDAKRGALFPNGCATLGWSLLSPGPGALAVRKIELGYLKDQKENSPYLKIVDFWDSSCNTRFFFWLIKFLYFTVESSYSNYIFHAKVGSFAKVI